MWSVDAILNQIRGILDRVSQAVSVVLYFVLAGGVLVLTASIQTSLPERRKESAILRSLGGSDRLLSQSQWAHCDCDNSRSEPPRLRRIADSFRRSGSDV